MIKNFLKIAIRSLWRNKAFSVIHRVFVLAGTGAVVIALVTISSQAIKVALANPVRSLRNE